MLFYEQSKKLHALKFMQITLNFHQVWINSLSHKEELTKALCQNFLCENTLFSPCFECIIAKYSFHITFALITINLYCCFANLLPEMFTLYTYVHTYRKITEYFLLRCPSNEKTLESRLAVTMLNFPKNWGRIWKKQYRINCF